MILSEGSPATCIQNFKDHLFNLIVPIYLKVRNEYIPKDNGKGCSLKHCLYKRKLGKILNELQKGCSLIK